MDLLLSWVNAAACGLISLALVGAILSPKVHDGVVIKVGLICLAAGFGAIAVSGTMAVSLQAGQRTHRPARSSLTRSVFPQEQANVIGTEVQDLTSADAVAVYEHLVHAMTEAARLERSGMTGAKA